MRRARAEGRSNGYENNPARRAVAAAVKAGLLVNLKKDYTVCADAAIRLTCAGRASMYDHRDYARPLDVEPVCRSCNGRRGAARKAELAVAS